MDKFFLLTYTCIGPDGFRRSYHGWFETEEDLRNFVQAREQRERQIEVDLSIEIQSYREVKL